MLRRWMLRTNNVLLVERRVTLKCSLRFRNGHVGQKTCQQPCFDWCFKESWWYSGSIYEWTWGRSRDYVSATRCIISYCISSYFNVYKIKYAYFVNYRYFLPRSESAHSHFLNVHFSSSFTVICCLLYHQTTYTLARCRPGTDWFWFSDWLYKTSYCSVGWTELQGMVSASVFCIAQTVKRVGYNFVVVYRSAA